jgi:hypothetical protein
MHSRDIAAFSLPERCHHVVRSLTVALEVLYRALMLFGRRASLKRPQIAPLARLRMLLP